MFCDVTDIPPVAQISVLAIFELQALFDFIQVITRSQMFDLSVSCLII